MLGMSWLFLVISQVECSVCLSWFFPCIFHLSVWSKYTRFQLSGLSVRRLWSQLKGETLVHPVFYIFRPTASGGLSCTRFVRDKQRGGVCLIAFVTRLCRCVQGLRDIFHQTKSGRNSPARSISAGVLAGRTPRRAGN